MKIRPFAAVAGTLVFVFSAGFAVGQQTETNDTEFENLLSDADRSRDMNRVVGGREQLAKAADSTLRATLAAVGNSSRTNSLAKEALRGSFSGALRDTTVDSRFSALQVTQNQKLIEQNQRIIELLERLNDKK